MTIGNKLALLAAALISVTAFAQTPEPVVVQAMPGATSAEPAAAANAQATGAAAALAALQAMKAANEEILRKQAATLQQLDELEKAVEQMKIYTKRG